MIHTTKNTKWVIAASLVCIFFGLLTFYTFINRSFIELNDFNLQILLFIDLILLLSFLLMIFRETYKILNERKKRKLGSETTLRYIIFFFFYYFVAFDFNSSIFSNFVHCWD